MSILGSIAGAVAGGLISKSGQDDANKQSAKMAREQMAFEERMSNTAMRRRVVDLKAAGLNPMLAGINQQGASTPAGAKSTYENSMLPMGNNISGIMPKIAQVENLQANTAKQMAETEQSKTQATLNAATARNVEATIPTHASQIDLNSAQTAKLKSEIPLIASEVGLNTQKTASLNAEMPNIVKTGLLLDADTRLRLTQQGLTLSEITKVGEELKKIQAEVANLEQETRVKRAAGGLADSLNVDAATGAINSAADWVGRSAGKYVTGEYPIPTPAGVGSWVAEKIRKFFSK